MYTAQKEAAPKGSTDVTKGKNDPVNDAVPEDQPGYSVSSTLPCVVLSPKYLACVWVLKMMAVEGIGRILPQLSRRRSAPVRLTLSRRTWRSEVYRCV